MLNAWRRGRVLVVILALVAAVLAPIGVGADRAQAVTAADWDPGYIISDANFYNGSAMSEAEIQRFLEARVGTCLNSNCLAVYRADTPTRTWSFGTCGTYHGGAAESAARIIFKVQQACNLSAKVILVTLQKEQSLVSDRAPSDGVMRKAMGYGCPDTASCDSTYYGFFNQIFAAGRQLTWYGNPAGSFTSIRVGEYNAIRYHPNAGCGSRSVLVRNRATAALYYYTPYTPNAAALANLGGLGDACSAYGNRNFWMFYINWFGPTVGPDGRMAISSEYAAQGGPTGHLGQPITEVLTISENGGGLGQAFQYGSIYWTASTGALTLRAGAIRDYYFRFGGAAGPIGWPVLNQQPISENGGGLGQLFTGGSVYSSQAGTFLVKAPMRDGYFEQNGAAGPLGWPVADQDCGLPGGACIQRFAGGDVYWTQAGGAHATWGAIRTAYAAAGGFGSWGSPTSALVNLAGGAGVGQAFTKGSAFALGSTAYFVEGAIRDLYFTNGGATGRLGFPTGPASCGADGTCSQDFQFGVIMDPSNGAARVAAPDIEAAHGILGGASGVLGPVSGPLVYYPYGGGGLAQGYASGAIFRKYGGGAFAVYGVVRDAYFANAGAAGRFGWPTSSLTCGSPGGSCRQEFEGATVHWTAATGAFGVSGVIRDAYDRAGGPGAAWGWPTTHTIPLPGGTGQAFTSGSAYATSAGQGYFVSGAIRGIYFGYGGATGALGYPTADATCGQPGNGCVQPFQQGSIYAWEATGAQAVLHPFLEPYTSAGGPAGSWGLPTTPAVALPYGGGGTGQAFQNASIYNSTQTGTHAVTGAIRVQYFALAGAAGALGYPTGDAVCGATGCSQSFQGGVLRTNAAGDPVR
ncbi:LGFP repeat-containing protein [Agromyces sp. NPDC056965]|uniref:LGFP repeat-containing protein n=1 Tax=Agromyces sp. NPDC056965 TaxID=3345983 RepID=UPI00363E9350